jgi:ribosomal protein L11 methyltransferase
MKGEIIWKTSVTTAVEAEDAVAELLTTLVAPHPSTYTDAESGVPTISVYTTAAPRNVAATKAALRRGLAGIKACGLDVGPGRISLVKLPRENWAESWKRHFPPLEIEARLLVKPSWSKRKPRAGQALVTLDPGLSFGTGQHPTTEFCLREIARHTDGYQPNSLLDMGTGSGILAIAAAKLGYAPVHAFDFDPQCVRVAKANAMTNRVAKKTRITRADLTKLPRCSSEQYDVVCANLLADLLIAERDRILNRVKPGGVLVVAGILKREFGEVAAVYRGAGMKSVASKVQNEWQSATFKRSQEI